MAPGSGKKKSTPDVSIPGTTWLVLLLVMPFLLHLLRPYPYILTLAALTYLLLVIPRALGPQMPQAAPRKLARVLSSFTKGCVGWCVQVVRFMFVLVFRTGLGLVTCVMGLPYSVAFILLPYLHTTYISLRGLSTITSQVVFFLLLQQLLDPGAPPITALHTLLFYTLVTYVYHALFKRKWGRGVGTGGDRGVVGLAAWWAAGRMGKGVASSCILVTFTSLRAAELRPDALQPSFILATLVYFVATLAADSASEGVSRALWWAGVGVGVGEEFWVWVFIRAVPIVSSAVVGGLLAIRLENMCPSAYLLLVSLYTNLAAPLSQVHTEVKKEGQSHKATLALVCRRPTEKELSEGRNCPVCLEGVEGGGRVTPCQHLFHAPCLSDCLAVSPLCPLCRKPVKI